MACPVCLSTLCPKTLLRAIWTAQVRNVRHISQVGGGLFHHQNREPLWDPLIYSARFVPVAGPPPRFNYIYLSKTDDRTRYGKVFWCKKWERVVRLGRRRSGGGEGIKAGIQHYFKPNEALSRKVEVHVPPIYTYSSYFCQICLSLGYAAVARAERIFPPSSWASLIWGPWAWICLGVCTVFEIYIILSKAPPDTHSRTNTTTQTLISPVIVFFSPYVKRDLETCLLVLGYILAYVKRREGGGG